MTRIWYRENDSGGGPPFGPRIVGKRSCGHLTLCRLCAQLETEAELGGGARVQGGCNRPGKTFSN